VLNAQSWATRLALVLVVLLASSCGIVGRGLQHAADASQHAGHFGRSGRLTPQELQWARTAWRYVENNTDFERGLVAGADRKPTFSMADAAEYIAALVAARELAVMEGREFDYRTSRLLGFLANMDLSGGALPNKVYSTRTGKMVGFDGQPADIGWSANDIGRLMLWLRILGQRHPQFQEYADKVVIRWRFCEVLDDCGGLHGVTRTGAQASRYREGRLGYEQLAAAGFGVWGFETRDSGSIPKLDAVNIYGIRVHYDARDPRSTQVPAPVLTSPNVLMGMELGWSPPAGAAGFRELAEEVFRVQEERWRRERQFTARTDYQVGEPPYVVLDSVYASGYAWNTIGSDNKEYEKLALVSTRAAFGMWALWPGEYTDRLIGAVQYLYDPDRGWYEGRLELGGAPLPYHTLATNAGVLRALLFKVKGQLYSSEERPGYFQAQTQDAFARMAKCLPNERPMCTAKVPAGR
jgi:hypothetical protein